jgi:phosphatidylserine/phosphatidylglycerophosphate/cardiolipin synthase-like enzyme
MSSLKNIGRKKDEGRNIRKLRMVKFIILLLASFSIVVPTFAEPIKATGTMEVYFSPCGGATEAIVREIDQAKREILVQAYSFTSPQIAQALVQAWKRGVKVEAVLDKSQRKERYTGATFLNNAGVPVMIDAKHAIAHNKIMVIDRETLITGSFNFTKAAEEKNAENLLVIKGNKPLVNRYLENYRGHKGHAEPYERR